MLIPCQGITFPNELRNVYRLSSEQKLLVYEVVHQKLGNPPTELLLPTFEDLRSEVSSVSQSVWIYEFNDVVTDLHFYNTYVSDTAVSA